MKWLEVTHRKIYFPIVCVEIEIFFKLIFKEIAKKIKIALKDWAKTACGESEYWEFNWNSCL